MKPTQKVIGNYACLLAGLLMFWLCTGCKDRLAADEIGIVDGHISYHDSVGKVRKVALGPGTGTMIMRVGKGFEVTPLHYPGSKGEGGAAVLSRQWRAMVASGHALALPTDFEGFHWDAKQLMVASTASAEQTVDAQDGLAATLFQDEERYYLGLYGLVTCKKTPADFEVEVRQAYPEVCKEWPCSFDFVVSEERLRASGLTTIVIDPAIIEDPMQRMRSLLADHGKGGPELPPSLVREIRRRNPGCWPGYLPMKDVGATSRGDRLMTLLVDPAMDEKPMVSESGSGLTLSLADYKMMRCGQYVYCLNDGGYLVYLLDLGANCVDVQFDDNTMTFDVNGDCSNMILYP